MIAHRPSLFFSFLFDIADIAMCVNAAENAIQVPPQVGGRLGANSICILVKLKIDMDEGYAASLYTVS